MLEQMVDFLVSWFSAPTIWGVCLAILFGAFWLAAYWPSLFKKPWLWAVLVGSAVLTLLAVTFIQMPLQTYTGEWFVDLFGVQGFQNHLLLMSILPVLISGLVQEGAKLVPVVVYWCRSARNIDPKVGLAIGAIAGAGFGIFEAQWAHNMIFNSGWEWASVQTGGFLALAGFWERFFTVAFHIAASALAGYGLAKGWGWQFYLLASVLHAIVNFGIVLLQAGAVTIIQVEIYFAVVALAVTVVVLWLRWRNTEEEEAMIEV